MAFREYAIARDGDEIVVSGTIREPVTWDFTIRINGDDIPGMLRLGLHRHTLAMAVRWVLRRPVAARKLHDEPAVATRSRPTREPPVAVPQPDPEPDLDPDPVLTQLPEVQPPGPAPSIGARTPDFGVPRRRGEANGHAPTEISAQGGRR